ncbi:MAG TPA: ATP-binding cassette domain-containing protein [Spirochaetota bacterium]|nr:ATP-binding cassette domain-containing protein [Spirochaetota bacterium]HPJ34409.1 ATP-binding cassette domain-containing protein [Spirochaetota bacterium]
MSFLVIEDLQVDLKEFKLKGIDFSLEEGEYLTIIGPTGAGKTILLESIIGFHKLLKGKIMVNGRDITGERPERRRMGIVYQDYALLPHFTIRSNIEYGLKKKLGAGDPSIPGRIEKLASSLNISHLLERKPGTLSGGEQQRAAIARALAVEPRVLLMDEPFSALDPQTRKRTRRLLKKIISDSGTTVIHITHDMEDVWTFADKVSVLRNGEQLQFGTADEIFQRPACMYTADFVGTSLYPGVVEKRTEHSALIDVNGLKLNSADVAVLEKSSVDVAIRPENIFLSEENPGKSLEENVIHCMLADIMEEGSVCTALVSYEDIIFESLVDRATGAAFKDRIGKDIFAVIKNEHVRLIPR